MKLSINHLKYKIFYKIFSPGIEDEKLVFYAMIVLQIWRFFWSVFSYIWTEYRDLIRKFPYLVRIQDNTDQKKLRVWTISTQCYSLKHFFQTHSSFNISELNLENYHHFRTYRKCNIWKFTGTRVYCSRSSQSI